MSTRASLLVVVLGLLTGMAAPATAQGGPKKYAVTADRAFVVTKEVLGKQGFEVVRIEDVGPDRIIYYRRGNMGRGKGKGPPQSVRAAMLMESPRTGRRPRCALRRRRGASCHRARTRGFD